MKDEMNQQDIRRDPLVGAALRWADGEVPLDEVDWAAMRTTIRNRASLPLARRRARSVRPKWLTPLIPLAAAAGIAMVIWTGIPGSDAPGVNGTAVAASGAAYQLSMQEALLADMSEQEFRMFVAERSDPDALLMIAASEQ